MSTTSNHHVLDALRVLQARAEGAPDRMLDDAAVHVAKTRLRGGPLLREVVIDLDSYERARVTP